MSRVGLIAIAVVGAGCTAEPEETQISGLRIFERDAQQVSGTFVEGDAAIDFSFRFDGTKHLAIIRSADGRPLIDSTLVSGVERTTYLGRATVEGTYDREPALAGDPTALDELALLPEARLVQPLRDALERSGIAKDLYANARSPEPSHCVTWGWWARCNTRSLVSKL